MTIAYEMKAAISSPQRWMISVLLIAASSLAILVVYRTTGNTGPVDLSGFSLHEPDPTTAVTNYYVSTSGKDSNNGSAAKPWATIERADSLAVPGSVIHVAPGTYNYPDELKTKASGSPEARIRFISDEKWGAKLRASRTGNSAVWASYGNYVDIVGFDISGSGAIGIYVYGSNSRILSNHVHDVPATDCPSTGGAGILNGNFRGKDNDATGNVVHDIGDYDHPCPRVHGIYQTNYGGQISNNLVFRNQGWGIHLSHAATDAVIVNNTVFNNAYGGILLSAYSKDFPSGSGSVSNSLVANNIVYRNGLASGAAGYGIEEYGSAVGENNRFVNNLVYQNGPADLKLDRGRVTGTIKQDPQFQNYTGGLDGDYRLKTGSPALKAARKECAPRMDVAGSRRPGGMADLGAYQSESSPGAWPFQ